MSDAPDVAPPAASVPCSTDPARAVVGRPAIARPWSRGTGQERRSRVRVQQSGISFLTYLAGGLVAGWGAWVGVVSRALFIPWIIALTIVCTGFFALARSRIGLRIHDATFTEIQILWGILVIDWAYAMCGAWRSSTLLPMILAINFGALTMNGRQLARVTIVAILSFVFTIALLHLPGAPRREDLWLDLSNLAFVVAILPCAALLSARFGVVRQRLRTQRLQLEDALARIEQIAILDPLTGIPNRRHALAQLAGEAERLARGGPSFTIALIDLDRFKQVNDSHGHGQGDNVLRRFADLASAQLRANDIIARWGGEEFLLLAPNTDVAGVRALIERICSGLRATAHEGLPADFRITASVGVARAAMGESIERLLERADEALYRAKRLGRDRTEEASVPTVE